MGLASAIGVEGASTAQLIWLAIYTFLAYAGIRWVYHAIYTLYFHPLKDFPGPKRWLLFPITRQIDSIRGIREYKIHAYHQKYGHVVRGLPDQLTFTAPEAWKDIYGHGHPELPKDGTNRGQGVPNIINADAKTHFRYRRAMLPAFSDKALNEQEHIIISYVDLLMNRLNEVVTKSEPTDMVKWFNFTTFDLIGDLAFGESFGGLAHSGSNAWLKRIATSIRMLPLLLTLRMYVPGLGSLLAKLFAKSAAEHQSMVQSLVQKRISNASAAHRGDFMDQMMRSRGSNDTKTELTDAELAANADIMMIAGSETTATLLAGVTYLLLSHPTALARAQAEIRGAFPNYPADKDTITFTTTSTRLPYTLACLTEALRIYPPVPVAIFRTTLPTTPLTPIAGRAVPPNTKVGVPQYAAYRSARNFARPDEFLPERWLVENMQDEKSEFYGDRREAHRPFSAGPRDCIGRNLAFHEMRVILARLLWEFDLELADEESNGGGRWLRGQKVRVFWDKRPLMVKLRKREG